jgi:hypothetical protein
VESDTRKKIIISVLQMKIAILTCDQLPNLNLQDQPNTGTVKTNITASQWFGIIKYELVILIF